MIQFEQYFSNGLKPLLYQEITNKIMPRTGGYLRQKVSKTSRSTGWNNEKNNPFMAGLYKPWAPKTMEKKGFRHLKPHL